MKHPTREECEQLLEEYGTPQHVRRHCREVTRTALVIAAALNEKGYKLDPELILAAGMLHDIARVEEDHGRVGAELIEKLGYNAEADIIRVHMKYSTFSPVNEVNETDMICLADRLVKEDTYVGLDARIDYIIDKARKNGHEKHIPVIIERREHTRKYMEELASVIGVTIDELMAGKSAESDDLINTENKTGESIA